MRKIILFLSLWSASLAAADFPMVIDPVVNATPPGATVAAGYLTLVNKTEKTITISSAYSPSVSQVEIHLSSVKNDVASMKKQDSVTIEAGGSLVFEHGSYHLMLMQLTEPLKENDSVDIILTTSLGDMLIEMPVRKLGVKQDKHAGMEKSGHAEMEKGERAEMEMNKTAHTDTNESISMSKDGESTDKSAAHNDMKKDGEAHTEKTKVIQ